MRSNVKAFIGFILTTTILAFSCSKQPTEMKPQMVQSQIGDSIQGQLDPYIESMLSNYDIPGLAIGIVKDNDIVFAKAYGFKDNSKRSKLELTHIFHMASVSKPFVASSIMQLEDQGKIHLDSTIGNYLSYFKLQGDDYKDITIQQMLSHTSGMPDVENYQWDQPEYGEDAIENYVRSLANKELIGRPGSQFAYSNMAYECLGDVVAKISGQFYADYVKEHILVPAGMNNSDLLMNKELPDDWAVPHRKVLNTFPSEVYPYNRRHGPSSTLHSNIFDMCQWIKVNLNRGQINGQKIIPSKAYDLMWKKWFDISDNAGIGLSWFLTSYQGKKVVSHSGGDIGFSTNLSLMPEENIGIVVLSNRDDVPVREVTRMAYALLLKKDHQPTPIPASYPISRTLFNGNVNDALHVWDSLKTHHPETYDFSPQHFSILYTALELDQTIDASKLTRFCVAAFPEEIKTYLIEQTTYFAENHPDNITAEVMLEILKEN